jgi:hypothetical protein
MADLKLKAGKKGFPGGWVGFWSIEVLDLGFVPIRYTHAASRPDLSGEMSVANRDLDIVTWRLGFWLLLVLVMILVLEQEPNQRNQTGAGGECLPPPSGIPEELHQVMEC